MPPSWSPNIVSFKTYNTGDTEGMGLWEAVNDRLNRIAVPGMAEAGARYGEPQLIRPRLGQGAFRVLVTDIYKRRCAVTQERTLPALEAAHIRPYGDGGEHEPCNGLLLRRDIHSLFDAGYVTVTPSLHFEVSPRIKEEFENGRHYYALHGQRISAPEQISQHPAAAALTWQLPLQAVTDWVEIRSRSPRHRHRCRGGWVSTLARYRCRAISETFLIAASM